VHGKLRHASRSTEAVPGLGHLAKGEPEKRKFSDVMAEMKAKVLENSSKLARALTEGGTDSALEFALATPSGIEEPLAGMHPSEMDAGNSTGVIDLTSGPPGKRKRLLVERGLLGWPVSASIATSSSWAGAGAGGLAWQTIMQRVLRELRMMVGTGTLERHVVSMDPLFKNLDLLQIVPCTTRILRKQCIAGRVRQRMRRAQTVARELLGLGLRLVRRISARAQASRPGPATAQQLQ
jgi:hypothetical protein